MARFEAQSQELIENAAQSGMPDALYELGLMYCTGRDVSFDLVEAHKWFNLAALRGNEEARRYRAEISRELSRREIGEAQRRAREWLSRH
jgi:TPR repeat protein